jgi:hypothetical protein
MGLSVYGLDGTKRFHPFREQPVFWVQTGWPYAYVARMNESGWVVRNGRAPVTVDLRSGAVVSVLKRYRNSGLPWLVVP